MRVTNFVNIQEKCTLLINNKEKVIEYRKGKTKLLGYFVGEAMKASQGRANPKMLNKILLNKLK